MLYKQVCDGVLCMHTSYVVYFIKSFVHGLPKIYWSLQSLSRVQSLIIINECDNYLQAREILYTSDSKDWDNWVFTK